MACKANSWRPAESISMAITAFSGEVGTSQRESRVIVVKAVFGIAGRVAIQAGLVVINISADFIMFFVCIALAMAIDT